MITGETLPIILAATLALGVVGVVVFILTGGKKRWSQARDEKRVGAAEAKRELLEKAKGSKGDQGQAAALSWLKRNKADLQGEDFSDLMLDGVELDNYNFEETSFARSSLKNSRFARAELMYTDFSGAELNEANFVGCTARKANFSGARMTRASFAQADLSVISAPRVLASEVKFWDCDLNGSIFEEAVLENAEFTGATLTSCNMNRAALGYAALDGTCMQKAMLNGATLDSATLQNADLRKAHMVEANLSNTDLENANMTWVRADGANFSYSHLAGAILVGASLRECDLTGAVLDGVDLTGADLTGARNLTQAQLQNTFFRSADTPETEALNRPKLPEGLELPSMRPADSGY